MHRPKSLGRVVGIFEPNVAKSNASAISHGFQHAEQVARTQGGYYTPTRRAIAPGHHALHVQCSPARSYLEKLAGRELDTGERRDRAQSCFDEI